MSMLLNTTYVNQPIPLNSDSVKTKLNSNSMLDLISEKDEDNTFRIVRGSHNN